MEENAEANENVTLDEPGVNEEPEPEPSPVTGSQLTSCRLSSKRFKRAVLIAVIASLITFGVLRMCLTSPNTKQCLNTTAFVWSKLLIGHV